METQANNRDRTLLACAAQEPKLLPPQKKTKDEAKERMRASAGKHFTTNNERKGKTKSQ